MRGEGTGTDRRLKAAATNPEARVAATFRSRVFGMNEVILIKERS
jgi:hypothetical protein